MGLKNVECEGLFTALEKVISHRVIMNEIASYKAVAMITYLDFSDYKIYRVLLKHSINYAVCLDAELREDGKNESQILTFTTHFNPWRNDDWVWRSTDEQITFLLWLQKLRHERLQGLGEDFK
ncbi:hypothetical protein J6TS7_29010 [Paenibacillus dendritiformis]|uniref:hypothetical protein n=1 Tax=Paenibacillus TaxID=44249 RepID=UPI001B26E121|nr:hypothetical protein [Paenibacillus dendritiformis]GIO79291.1 hypothetical protein J6TS7_29010 [Paenibacillus dendritiformis]